MARRPRQPSHHAARSGRSREDSLSARTGSCACGRRCDPHRVYAAGHHPGSGLAACAIAEGLGLADINASDLPKRARAACERHPTLLVLDNFEQVLEASPLVADLLTSVMSLRVLVTSRAPLHVRGEREYALGPLALEGRMRSRRPIWQVPPRCDSLRSAFKPCSRTFASRLPTLTPLWRFVGGSMHCRSRSNWLLPG